VALDFARANRRNHQYDLFDAARGLFDHFCDGRNTNFYFSISSNRQQLVAALVAPFCVSISGRLQQFGQGEPDYGTP